MNASKISDDTKPKQTLGKKELFASTIMDINDVSVLDKHCCVKSADNSTVTQTKGWAEARSGRFYWQNYFDRSQNQIISRFVLKVIFF